MCFGRYWNSGWLRTMGFVCLNCLSAGWQDDAGSQGVLLRFEKSFRIALILIVST